jgi:hypothetical protein
LKLAQPIRSHFMDFVVDVHNITEKERIVASAPFSKVTF